MSRVYVGGIAESTRERDLEHFFRRYGRIREIVLKGVFGFVEFSDYRDADDAVHDLNGAELNGARVRVEHTKRRPGQTSYRSVGGRGDRGGGDRYETRRPIWLDKYGAPERTRYRVLFKNLSTAISWQDLKDRVRQIADVTYAEAHKERKNEGLICCKSSRGVKLVVEKFDGVDINGRVLEVVDDTRASSGSRSRSRSRSHDRSRSRSPREKKRRSRSRSRSRSGSERKSASRSASRSRSRSAKSDRSRSPAPQENGKEAD